MNTFSFWGLTGNIEERRLSTYSWLIILTGILLIGGIWLFSCYQINYDYDRTIAEASQETMNLTTAFEEYMLRIIADVDKDLLNLKLTYEREGMSSPSFRAYAEQAAKDPSRSRVAFINEQGVVEISPDMNAIGASSSDREFFLVHRNVDSNKLDIGKPFIGRVDGTVTIPMTRRINKPDGSFGGIVYIGLKVNFFPTFYDKINLGQNQLISLIGSDGFTRARQNDNNFEFDQDVRGSEFWKNVQGGRAEATFLAKNILDGVTRVISYRVMPEYSLIVAVGKSTQVALAGFEQRKQGYIFGGSLVSLFIMIFCTMLISRHEKARRLTKAIQQEKDRLSALINSLNDEVWFYDAKKRLILVNPVVVQGFDLSPAVIIDAKEIGGSFEALCSNGRPRPAEEAPLLRALQGEVIRNQHEIVRIPTNGEWRHREVNATAVKDTNGNIIGAVAIVRDITERRRMEDELAQHHIHLESLVLGRTQELENAVKELQMADNRMAEQSKLLDSAHDYIMVRDLSSRVVYWNQGAEKGYGFTADEAEGRVTHELLQTEFPEPEGAIWSKLLAGGHWEGELKHTCRDGVQIVVQSNQTLNLDEEDNPVSIMEINHDITEKNEADEMMRELNLKLQNFNAELEHTVAERTMELQDSNASLEEEIMERQASQESLSQLNCELTDMNAALEEEIMERQSAEKSLLKAKEEAERATIAKSNFLANMSHEIRTPMNGIIGMTDITLMTDLQEKQREYLKVVKSSTMALLRVLNDILDYSKIEAGKVELEEAMFDVWETTNEVIDLFNIAAKQKGLCIKLNIGKEIPHRIIGDSVRLRQVLSNLVGNGVKFTFHGEIVIGIDFEKRYNDKVRLKFVVTDTGIGIADDKLDKLFKRFSQIDDSYTKQFGGTGLGLAISQKLIELMNGEIGVKSKEGVGSSFFFTAVFGLQEGQIKAIDSAQKESIQNENTEHKKILLAEDDLISRNLATLILEKNGFEVIAVENGKQAVDAFEQEKFELILMDINMPHLDGYTATGMIRVQEKKIKFHTPIIAMTAYALKGDREKCLAAGMDDYISKPIELDKFIELINKWLTK